MFRGSGRLLLCALVASLLILGFSLPVPAQALHSIIQPSGQLFPSVGPGVSAIKKDSQGRFYILAKPATYVGIYSADGQRIGQIPPPDSSAKVVYAMDFDLGADGEVFVADRGSNAVLIFRPDGSLVARIPVFAPTSVVALSNHEFAVASFHARRLVDVFDERGEMIRSFGDPADSAAPVPSDDPLTPQSPPVYLGRIFGDPQGQIFFAFTSMQDPTFRRYDRYGYVAYEASVPEGELAAPDNDRFDRFQFSFGFTRFDLSDQFIGSATVGSSGDIRFGGGIGAGLGAHLNRVPGDGELGSGGLGGGGRGEGFGEAFGGTPAGMLSAQASLSSDSFHILLGGNPGAAGGNGRFGANSAANSDSSSNVQGSVLQFARSGSSAGVNGSSSDDSEFAQLESSDILNSSSDTTSNPGFSSALSSPDDSALGSSFTIPGDLGFGGGGFGGPGGGGFGEHFLYNRFFGGGFDFARQGNLNSQTDATGTSGGTGSHAGAGASSESFPHFGPHGHFGPGMTGMTAGVRINLDKPVRDPNDKPVFTALAIDPDTQNVWAAIGDSLVLFDKTGSRLAVFTLVNDGNVPMRPSAILVERNRLIVAVDPWGIFQFARPDAYLSPALRSASPSGGPSRSSSH